MCQQRKGERQPSLVRLVTAPSCSASRNREIEDSKPGFISGSSKHTFHNDVPDVPDSRILTAISLKREVARLLWLASRHWESGVTSIDLSAMRGPVRLVEFPIAVAALRLGRCTAHQTHVHRRGDERACARLGITMTTAPAPH